MDLPGDLLAGGHLQGVNPVSAGMYSYNTITPLELMPNTPYYLVVGVEPLGTGPDIGQFLWRLGSQPATGSWDVSTTIYREHPLYGWFYSYTLSPIFSIDATAVPEPSTGLLLVMAAMTLSVCGQRKVRVEQTGCRQRRVDASVDDRKSLARRA